MTHRKMILLLALTLAACSKSPTTAGGSAGSSSEGSTGGTGGSSGGTTGGGLTATQRCQQLAQASCQHDAACGFLDPTTEAVCEAGFACDNPVPTGLADARAAAGVAHWDDAALGRCTGDISAASCALPASEARSASANCQALGQGSTADGSACQVGAECGASSVCMRQVDACGGTCAAQLTQGACGPGQPPVAPGYYCGGDGGVAPQVGAGTACEADRDCRAGLYCVGPTGAKLCTEPQALDAGSPCDGAHQCAGGGSCLGARPDGGQGYCLPRNVLGGDCRVVLPDGGIPTYGDGGARFRDDLCRALLYCDPGTRTCAERAGLGAHCDLGGGEPSCLVGDCSPSTGTCVFIGDGLPCARGVDCESGVCVREADGGNLCAHRCP